MHTRQMKSLTPLSMSVALLLLCATAFTAWGAGEPKDYEKAKVELSRLRGDEDRAKYRHEWLRCADAFMDIYEKNPSWGNRVGALFRSAEALEEMARRSFTRKDAQNAALRFETAAKKHSSSALADDALYRSALIRKELMRDPKDARALLESIGKKYPRSDHATKAAAYLDRLDGGDVASLGPAPAAKSSSVETLVSQITPQVRKNVVRIVIALDRSVSWTVQLQAEDPKNGRPPRLILELDGASPDKALKSGARYSKMGVFTRYAVDYTASQGKTRILFDFSKLTRYTVKLEKAPFRLVVEATATPGALASGIDVGKAASVTRKPSTPTHKKTARSMRASAPANVAAQLGLSVRTIVIDPGHGGKDPGAVHNKIVERDVCLDIARRLGGVLTASGYKVVYTRDRNTWVSLSERTRLAADKKGDLLISIHVNASDKSDASGFETYYLDLAATRDSIRLASVENAGSGRRLGEMEGILIDLLLDARIQESRRLAGMVQDKSVAVLEKKGYLAKSGGTKGAPFHVLLGSSMPSILVEVGYNTNDAEAKRLNQSKYRDALAEGIANGVHAYARQLETAGR